MPRLPETLDAAEVLSDSSGGDGETRRFLLSPRRRSDRPRFRTVVVAAIIVPLVTISLFMAADWVGDDFARHGVVKRKQQGSRSSTVASTTGTCETEVSTAPIILPRSSTDRILRFACPCAATATPGAAANFVSQNHVPYNVASAQIATNVTSYLQVFRDMEFDDWGHSYDEVKKGMYKWKSKYFAELKNNSTIYESACGTGMNLYMTLEILAKVKGIKNIVVYGNEYAPESVQVANEIARRGFLPAGGQLGTICPGDSTNLRHVPSDSFDLVYTGYITPLEDPLGLNQSTKENFARYTQWCQQEDDESIYNRRQAQKAQNRWYGKWLQEMIRIAKPGAPIIVEQVSNPLCDATFDWGGVNRAFWSDAAIKQGWDIITDSIRFENDRIFRKRYHVFMRKKKG